MGSRNLGQPASYRSVLLTGCLSPPTMIVNVTFRTRQCYGRVLSNISQASVLAVDVEQWTRQQARLLHSLGPMERSLPKTSISALTLPVPMLPSFPLSMPSSPLTHPANIRMVPLSYPAPGPTPYKQDIVVLGEEKRGNQYALSAANGITF